MREATDSINGEMLHLVRMTYEAVAGLGVATVIFASCNAVKNLANHYVLKNKESSSIVRIDRMVERPKPDEKTSKMGIKRETNIAVKNFVSVFKNEGVPVDGIYENFRPFLVENKTKKTPKKSVGHYDHRKGKIVVDPENFDETINRGLLELATTHERETFTAYGFKRQNKNDVGEVVESFGTGLNEGYKEVILKRHFGIEIEHPDLFGLAVMIEMIVGSKNMETMFLNGDLRSLVDTLGPKGISWIKKMDYMYDAIYSTNSIIVKQLSKKSSRSMYLDVSAASVTHVFRKFTDLPLESQTREGASLTKSYIEGIHTLLEAQMLNNEGITENDLESFEVYIRPMIMYLDLKIYHRNAMTITPTSPNVN